MQIPQPIKALPKDWQVIRLKRIASLNPSKKEIYGLKENTEVTFLPMEAVSASWEVDYSHVRPIDEVRGGYTYFRNGDILVAKITPCFENGKGAMVLECVNGVGFGTTEFHVIRSPETSTTRYLSYVVRSHRFKTEGEAMMTGAAGQKRISDDYIKNFEICLPPLNKREAISTFLDRKTAAIDTLITKKQRLIELLEEKRAALINQAVTKGLNPDVPMKDSGIPWIGEIPEHWEVSRLGFVALSIQTGPFGSQLHAADYVDGKTPTVNPINIQNGRIVPDYQKTVDSETLKRLSRHKLKVGDLVFARRGELGRCGLVEKDAEGWLCGTGSMKVCLKQKRSFPPYLNLFISLKSVASWLSLESVGSTMDNLNTSILTRLPVLIPPKSEQIEIFEKVKFHDNHIDQIIQKVFTQIQKLQEYRQSLITAAVTGKLEVIGDEAAY